jgi:hypothetical protein
MQLYWHDLQWLLRRTPKPVLEELKARAGRVFIAGGAIRSSVSGEPISDFDLFVPNQGTAIEVANSLVKDKDRAKDKDGLLPGIYRTDNAFTLVHYKPVIQIIHRWHFDDPQSCIDSFDFTIAQAAFWWGDGKWKSCVAERFYPDLAAKRLIYTHPKRVEEVGGSLLRVLKFYQKGYRIPLNSLAGTIARVVREIDIRKADFSSEEKLTELITALLIEVDPSIDPEHIAHLPSEVHTTSEEKQEGEP